MVCDCGAVTSKARKPRADGKWECPECEPDSFPQEKFTMPSDKKVYQGYQVAPERYKKTEGPQGQTVYRASDVELQDLQDWVEREDKEDAAKEAKALEARRSYCAQKNLRPETQEEAERNAEQARLLLRQIEAEVRLEAMGFVLPK
jgi:hypothetical protein